MFKPFPNSTLCFHALSRHLRTAPQTVFPAALLIVILLLPLFSLAQYPDSIRLNDVRFLTSHNSYKRKPDPKILKFLSHFKKQLGKDMDPIQLDYGHALLTEQMDTYHINGFELDVNYDPKGGHFAKRRVNFFVGGLKQKSRDSLLRKPGFKILHIADVDYESNYTTFVQALTEIRDWSVQHPKHLPIFINIEIKRDAPADYSKALDFLGFNKSVPFVPEALNDLDNEIQSVFGKTPEILYTPAILRDTFSSCNERLSAIDWPALNDVLGKVFIVLDGDFNDIYMKALNTKENRPMFVYGQPGQPQTAFVIRNEPQGKEDEIRLLTELYMVRTRTDAGTLEARTLDYSRYNAVMKSQAQIITTDYYRADPAVSNFVISLEPFKKNPLHLFMRSKGF
jgi:hypothetical protein